MKYIFSYLFLALIAGAALWITGSYLLYGPLDSIGIYLFGVNAVVSLILLGLNFRILKFLEVNHNQRRTKSYIAGIVIASVPLLLTPITFGFSLFLIPVMSTLGYVIATVSGLVPLLAKTA